MVYAFSRLRAKGRDFRPLHDALRHNDYEALAPAKLWGHSTGCSAWRRTSWSW